MNVIWRILGRFYQVRASRARAAARRFDAKRSRFFARIRILGDGRGEK